MQTDRIIEKAKKLGLDIGNSDSQLDNLRTIASQVGLHDINDLDELERVLDEQIEYNSQVVEPQTMDENPSVRNEKFGQRQYDQAKNKDGIYDKNYYKNKQNELDEKAHQLDQERHKNWKMKKGETGPVKADGSNTQVKSKMNRVLDNLNYANAKKNALVNHVDEAKANAYNMMHPGEALKNKAKSEVKKGTNAVKKAAKEKAKVMASVAKKKIVAFIAANPWILLVIALIIFFIVILLLLLGDSDNNGYYSQDCNFNESSVVLTSCSFTESTKTLTIKDYVVGTTYALIKNGSYNDEVIKAAMIVLKTDALSMGNYNSASKVLAIDDCNYKYDDNMPTETKTKLSALYDSISSYLYLSSSYNSSINNVGVESYLPITIDTLNTMNLSTGTYQTILDDVYISDDENVSGGYRSTLYIGDSRTKGMIIAGLINEFNAAYGVGYGYNWLTGSGTFDGNSTNAISGAETLIDSKMSSNSSYNIVIWLGVNDLGNINNYYNEYYNLATNTWKNNNIYIVSVGPVDESKNSSITNESINNFNSSLRESIKNSGLENLHFIDVSYSIKNYDSMGLHYGNEDYKTIYNSIYSNIDTSLNNDYKIYDLSAHCTYYTLTDNDAYWWPIGSREATSGNIYGGAPTSTRITSYFGERKISGVVSNHGAIDIGATCNDNVVIAAKDGKVIKINDTCDNNGYYKNPCGTGLGNYVIIEHSDGNTSRYGHMYPNSITVQVGDEVKQGQKLGMVGNSGSSTGCHLHYEMRNNNVKLDPLKYVDPDNPRPTVSNNINIIATGDEGGKQNVCLALVASGFSKNAIAGIMVNMAAESGFRTNAVEYGSKYNIDTIYSAPADVAAGFGLVQWSYGRRINMINYAKSKGLSATSLQAQLEYFNKELNESYISVNKYVLGNYSAEEIGKKFCLEFESPAKKQITCPNRVNSGINTYIEYVNNGCK